MIYHLLYALRDSWSALNVFRYITFRSLLAASLAILISFLIGPWLIERLRRHQFGQHVRSDGPQTHLKKQGTPSSGGLLILIAILIPTLLCADLSNGYVWTVMGACAGFGLIGLWDDMQKRRAKTSKGLSARGKIVWQVLLAGLIAVVLVQTGFDTHLTVPFLKRAAPDLGWWFVPFTIFVLVGSANAVNLTDGLDGLAIGSAGIATATFAVITYCAGHAKIASYLGVPNIAGSGEVAVFAAAVVGACLGFLWFNAPPAQVFMGDVGSMALGGAIGTIAVICKQELLLAIAGGLFVLEALSVIVQVGSFKLRGTRVLRMAPLHHHFELSGWAETKVVTRFWILALLFAIAALATLKLR
jgi:phospho-N-acetylmuramoyl-pentapeptide-transferase